MIVSSISRLAASSRRPHRADVALDRLPMSSLLDMEKIPMRDIRSAKGTLRQPQQTTTVSATPLVGDAQLPLREKPARPKGAVDQPEAPTASLAAGRYDASSCGSGAFPKSVSDIPAVLSEVNNNEYTDDSGFMLSESYASSFGAPTGSFTQREVHFDRHSAKDTLKYRQQQASSSTTAPGKYQSPIDISDVAVVQDTSLDEICYGYRHDKCAVFVNDGVLPKCDVSPATHVIRGGPLLCDYELAQFHFHFAGPGRNGSEHSINGKRYPAEVHFVHYKAQYKSFEAALKHKDGLAVIAALLDVSDLPDVTTAAFDMDIQKFKRTTSVGSFHRATIDLSTYGLSSIEDYYTYNGSLTSPPCYECVCWLLLCRPITISTESYLSLTRLSSVDGGFISRNGNFREQQPLNDRAIRRSFCAMSRVLRIVRRPGTSSVGQQKSEYGI